MLYRAENYSNDNDINRICTAAESRRNRYLKAERVHSVKNTISISTQISGSRVAAGCLYKLSQIN